jgi:hypothetical protein
MMASEADSSSSTAIAADTPRLVPLSYHTTAVTDTPDIPIGLGHFDWNIRKCKASTAISCLVGALMNGWSIWHWQGFGKAKVFWTYLELGFQVSQKYRDEYSQACVTDVVHAL